MSRSMPQSIAIFFLALAVWSCNSPEREALPKKRGSVDVKSSDGEGGPSLQLTWQAQSGPVTTYHVFYVNEGKPREIDSLARSDAAFSSPKMTIDSSNMETWPEKGKQACFYVVADNSGVLSDPSDPACITL